MRDRSSQVDNRKKPRREREEVFRTGCVSDFVVLVTWSSSDFSGTTLLEIKSTERVLALVLGHHLGSLRGNGGTQVHTIQAQV